MSPPSAILVFSVFGFRFSGGRKGQDPVGGATGVRYTRRSAGGKSGVKLDMLVRRAIRTKTDGQECPSNRVDKNEAQ